VAAARPLPFTGADVVSPVVLGVGLTIAGAAALAAGKAVGKAEPAPE